MQMQMISFLFAEINQYLKISSIVIRDYTRYLVKFIRIEMLVSITKKTI